MFGSHNASSLGLGLGLGPESCLLLHPDSARGKSQAGSNSPDVSPFHVKGHLEEP